MAGVYQALGTAVSSTSGTTLTMSGVTVPQGANLHVMIAFASVVATITSVDWNGNALSQSDAQSNGLMGGDHWSWDGTIGDLPGGTGTLTVTFSIAVTKKALTAFYILGGTAAFGGVIKDATGTSTSPTTGAGATTGDNMVMGFIFTNGPVEDAAGTWSNSYNAGQRDGTTGGAATDNVTVSDAWRTVTGSSSVAAAKTGITSRNWIAMKAALPLVADLSTTLGAASGTATAAALTETPGTASLELGAASGAASAGALALTGAATLTLGACLGIGACLPLDVTIPHTTLYYANQNPATPSQLVDPFNGQTLSQPLTDYLRSGAAVRLPTGGKKIAYLQQHDLGYTSADFLENSTWPSDGTSLRLQMKSSAFPMYINASGWVLTAAFDGAPIMKTSPSEKHYLCCYYEVATLRMLMGIAVTPAREIVLTQAGLPDLRTPINTLPIDGQFHRIQVTGNVGLPRTIWLDNVEIIYDFFDPGFDLPANWTVAPFYGQQSQIMLLNGPDGLTNVAARVSRWDMGLFSYLLPSADPAVVHPTDENGGPVNTTFQGQVLNLDLDAVLLATASTDYGPLDLTPAATQLVPWNKTPYQPRTPANPGYVKIPQ